MAKPFAVPKLRSGDPCWVELTEDSRASGIIVALGEGQAVVQLDCHLAGDHRRFPLSQVYPRTRGGSALPVAAGSAEEADEDEPQPPDPFDQLLEAAQLVYAKLSGSFERHLTTSRVRRRQLTRVRRAIAVLAGVPITKLSHSHLLDSSIAAARASLSKRAVCEVCGADRRTKKHRCECLGKCV